MKPDSLCCCCKTNKVGTSKVFCPNCWDYYENEITMNDIAVLVSMLKNREPKNKHAKEICQYLVADNYMQGKAHLSKTKGE